MKLFEELLPTRKAISTSWRPSFSLLENDRRGKYGLLNAAPANEAE
jgi:hypothetical protein